MQAKEEKTSPNSLSVKKEEKPQKDIYLVPNMREYVFDKLTGSIRVADRRGMTRKERKEEQRAARKTRIKELKARKR